MGFIQPPSIRHLCIPLSICRYVTTPPALSLAPGPTIHLDNLEWLTSEGIIPTPDTPVIPTPARTPAIPPTPELSNASTPAHTTSTVPTPSDRGKKRTRREVVGGLSTFQQSMCLLILTMIRAFRTPMNRANRILPFLALLPKCRIQANHLCGLTIARSLSPMKKRRSSRNMPRRNQPNHQPPVKGSVESNDFRLPLRTSLRDLTVLLCMPAITLAFPLVVLSSQPSSCLSRPRHAQPHPPHNPQSKGPFSSVCFLSSRT